MKEQLTNHKMLAALLLALAMSPLILMTVALHGGEPMRASTSEVVTMDQDGNVRSKFKAGDWMIVRREVCSDRQLMVLWLSSVESKETRAFVVIPAARWLVRNGCNLYSHMVRIPPELLPGLYEYSTTASFQDNLIGRDQFLELPPANFMVAP